MKHHPLLISGAANTVSHSCVWIQNGKLSVIAYALHNLIAISDVLSNSVVCTLKSHSTKVIAITYCVFDTYVELYSGADDGSVHVWKHQFSDNLSLWERGADLFGLKSALTSISSLKSGDSTLVAASDSQGHVLVWSAQFSHHTLIDSLKLPPAQMAYNLSLSVLPNLPNKSSFIALFIGCVDARVHIFIASIESIQSKQSSSVFRSVGALVGHEEWITCLSTTRADDRTLLLASGSQDTKIRVWKIVVQASTALVAVSEANSAITSKDDDDEGEDIQEEGAEIAPSVNYEEEESLSEARLLFAGGDGQQSFAVFLDALLVGHEDWVTSLSWMPPSTTSTAASSSSVSSIRLFSTSMDRNMVIWAADEAAGGIWMPSVRVGDIGGSLGGSVGGNLLGFVGGCMCPDGRSILGIGYGGSFHLWSRTKQLINGRLINEVSRGDRLAFAAEAAEADQEDERWFPIPFLSGHFGSVNDLTWSSRSGDYLLTVSADQTCRLFCALKKLNVCLDYDADVTSSLGVSSLWKEVSRPQIHGYDMNCIALMPDSCVIFTGGEEKVIRVFDAPNVVLKGLEKLCGVTIENSDSANRIDQAYIPELGLSNKALDTMSNQEKKEAEARSVTSIDWRFHPLEGQLADHTLWPEIKKMFGHSNDVMCMSLSSDGQWLASANKARDANSATVLLWAAQGKELVTRLTGHESTVVCVQFSPNNRYLASSGKDRNLLLYRNDGTTFTHCTFKKAAHKRIVWDLGWTSDSSELITVSRDGICKVWRLVESADGSNVDLEAVHTFSPCGSVSVTALDVLPFEGGSSWLVAFGAESGDIVIEQLSSDGTANTPLCKVDAKYCHGATVKRIRWRPSTDSSRLHFASCGEDNTVRIHELSVGL